MRNIRLNMMTRKQPNKRNQKAREKSQKRRNSGAHPLTPAADQGRPVAAASASDRWIFGFHAVSAALANAKRTCKKLLLTAEAARRAEELFKNAGKSGVDRSSLRIERAERSEIERYLPPQAVHQGIALEADALPALALADLPDPPATGVDMIVLLDQVSDPHNVGAILRSAASFGARAVVMQERNAPPETGTMAKSASGALEIVPIVRVANLARALDTLADQGYWRVGLDAGAGQNLSEADAGERVVLVLGAEGKGLRRLTAQKCDILCKLPMAENAGVSSLNVSNAAAVALYELVR